MAIPEEADRQLKLQILSLEYQTLRSDILVRSSARYQFLGFATAAAAILATAAGSKSSDVGIGLIVLAVAVFSLGIGAFWQLGNQIAYLSKRVAGIEQRINELQASSSRPESLLSWEADHQHRDWFDRWVMGLRIPKREEMRGQIKSSATPDPRS